MSALSMPSAALVFLSVVVVASFPARAELDPVAVADLLAGAVGAAGDASATYEAATGDDAGVTITGFRAALADGTVASIPLVVVSAILPRDAGGFTAGRIDFDGGTVTAADRTLTWDTASIEDVVVPPADEVKGHPKVRPFRKLSVTSLSFGGGALTESIEAATLGFEVDEILDGGPPAAVRMDATGVRLPAGLLGNSFAGVIVGMLNYREFLADVSMDGVYDTAANTASIDTLAIDVATVGKVDVAARASGLSIRALTSPDDEISKAARANARLDSLRVRIDNAGFVERVLDMQAEMLGGTRDDVRAQIVNGALPFALSFVKNEAFRDEFRAAIAAFLADPRSLTIVARPAEPVPLGQVARAIVRAPMTLPDLLAPTVEANN
jgi:hypothetical protein